MITSMSIEQIVVTLIQERDRLNRAIEVLQDGNAGRRRKAPPVRSENEERAKRERKHHINTPEAKKAQSDRMKAFWAAKRRKKGTESISPQSPGSIPISTSHKRTTSSSSGGVRSRSCAGAASRSRGNEFPVDGIAPNDHDIFLGHNDSPFFRHFSRLRTRCGGKRSMTH